MKYIFKNLIQLFKEIKLAIKLKSFYVNKAFVSESDVLNWDLGYYAENIILGRRKRTSLYDVNGMRIIFQDCIGKRIKRLIQYKKDHRRFGWIIWYV